MNKIDDAMVSRVLSKVFGAVCLTFFCCLQGVYARQENTNVVSVVSGGFQPSVTGNNASSTPRVNSDGRYVCFVSRAANLVVEDQNGAVMDVFVRDLDTSKTVLVSRTEEGKPANGPSHSPQISDDGRYVLFISEASNLVSGDNNNSADIFLWDRETKETILISGDYLEGGPANGVSNEPLMTADARFVAFTSSASNLISNDENAWRDIFLHGVEEGITQRINLPQTSESGGQGGSWHPLISSDGQTIAFQRISGEQPRNNYVQKFEGVFIRNLGTDAAREIRILGADEQETFQRKFNPVLSSNGRYLGFQGILHSTLPGSAGIAWYDLEEDEHIVVAPDLETENETGLTDLSGPVMSDDGMTLAFEARETRDRKAVYIWNAETREVQLGSQVESAETEPFGYQPVLSSDGRYLAFLRKFSVDHSWKLYIRDLREVAAQFITETHDPAVSFSRDGQYMVFQSDQSSLVQNDRNAASDVFRYELATGSLQLISQAVPELSSSTPRGFSFSSKQALSADGQFAVFTSFSDDLVNDDANGFTDVFLRDHQIGQLTLISKEMDGNRSANGSSAQAVISNNGRFVAFTSSASNLVEEDSNEGMDVFLKDLHNNKVHRVSPEMGSNSKVVLYESLSISRDGIKIAFQAAVGALNYIYLYDHQTETSTRIDQYGEEFAFLEGGSVDPLISPTGNHVAYVADRSRFFFLYHEADQQLELLLENPSGGLTYAWSHDGKHLVYGDSSHLTILDLNTGSTRVISEPLTQEESETALFRDPSVAANGRRVAFVAHQANIYDGPVADTNLTTDVYLWDAATDRISPISINHEGTATGNARSDSPSISADGRYIIFRSFADDLINEGKSVPGIFLRDFDQATIIQLNHNSYGSVIAGRITATPLISPDGTTVLFNAWGDFLTRNDWNDSGDVFLYKLASQPVVDRDEDRMDDGWELAHFGTLNRNGEEDFDGDGVSDAHEYLAGSNPANPFSQFTGRILHPEEDGSFEIQWTAKEGRQYAIEFTDELPMANWQRLDVSVAITGGTATASIDPSGSTQHRYYRVVVEAAD